MADNRKLIEENERLKEEVQIYQKGYENILTEKLLLEQEYENYKLAMEESMKIKNAGIYGSTTVFNIQTDNAKYKSEIDEYLNRIWELETNLSLKDEEMRILSEKNKKLEEEKRILEEERKNNNKENNKSENENDENKENPIKSSRIFNLNDLYKSTIIQNTEKKMRNKIKQSLNLNIISEVDMEKIREEEEREKRRKEEEEFERQKKEEEERQRKLLEEEKIKKELQNKIKEYNKTKNELENKFQNIKLKSNEYYKDIQNLTTYINNYHNFVNELNEEINKLKDKLNISFYGEKAKEQQDKINIRIVEFTNSLEIISGKISQLSDFIDQCKNIELKNVENIQAVIQEKINEINNEKNNQNLIVVKNIYETNNNIIKNKIDNLEKILEKLKSNKKAYDNSKKSIEEEKGKLKEEIISYVEKVEKSFKFIMNQMGGGNNGKKDPLIDSIFLRGSMLLGIQDFSKVTDIFNSRNLFSEEDYDKCLKQDLLRKNWNEICYVYEEYDIHDVNYELKAVGLPPNTFFSSCSVGFVLDTDIEILLFEKDGKKTDYRYNHYSLEFDIHLKNLESNKIHLRYKESPLKNKMTEGEKKERKFVKNNYYGVSKNVAGENAKFTLKINCDFEVISFDQEFFLKTKEKEYTWGGKVPPEGKRTYVRMSKTKGNFNFLCSEMVKSKNADPLKNTKMTVPVAFVGGNNEIVKIDCSSPQTDNVTLKKECRNYEIHFLNTNSKIGEFKIQGELINRCKGEWVCDLTDEQIEKEIPQDYKYNKEQFKEFAQTIIKNYDSQHKNDLIKVPDIVKIGKWIKENIHYDISYSGRNEITATQTLNNKIGVCHHFTKVFNALLYSLGYQVIYVSGYALDKKDTFGKEDAHAWSLVKIDGKWLPFDATWGFFSGKIPVCHVFKQYFPNGTRVIGTDKIEFGNGKDEGKFLNNNI